MRPATKQKNRIRNRAQVAQALELRRAGATFEQIGGKLNLSRQRAYQIVTEGLADLDASCAILAGQTRRLQLDRIDSILLSLWPQRANPRHADSLMRLFERQARLLGLDAPQKVAETDAAGNDVTAEARAVRARLLAP